MVARPGFGETRAFPKLNVADFQQADATPEPEPQPEPEQRRNQHQHGTIRPSSFTDQQVRKTFEQADGSTRAELFGNTDGHDLDDPIPESTVGYLFVAARSPNQRAGVEDVPWKR
jgi:hypothetical protein